MTTAIPEKVREFAINHIAQGATLEIRQTHGFLAYYVSEHGHIFSAKRPKIRFMTVCLNQGYKRTSIGNCQPLKAKSVHRIVLEAFCGPPPPGMQARHKNGIRHDARLVNLEWGTIQDNSDDRTRHGTQPVGVRNPRAKLTEDQVRIIRAGDKKGPDIAREFGVHKNTIYNIRNRDNWKNVL